ncbi:DUF4124 domain-containing protein [Thauera sp.]|uniref:DUF4124 domain-containing protein n=1 Tax=Thauera sp. TaxID=1905334 RepID=UPI0039E3F1BF
MNRIAFFLLMLFASTCNAHVYKCSEGGKTVFSDKPCGEEAETIDVAPAAGRSWQERQQTQRPVQKEQPSKESPQERAARAKKLEDERNARWEVQDAAREAGAERDQAYRARMAELRQRACGSAETVELRLGMTERFVRTCTYTPSPRSINTTTTAQREVVQWVMGGDGGYRFIYFENGVVSAIQH